MKYSCTLVALIFSLFSIVHAEQHEQTGMEESAADDYRATCIEAAIADEVEKGEQFDKYIAECVAAMETGTEMPKGEGGE
jgi:hypothetical protein